MSDLIDFDSPETSKTNSSGVHMLASPLIPSPEAIAGAPSLLVETRRSIENNPFDMVLKKITEYERNKEDPFEKVSEKAMNGRESKDDFRPRRRRSRHSDILKLNKTFDGTESNVDLSLVNEGVNDISIITDLNDTNLIADNVAAGKGSVGSWDCDKKSVPQLNVSPSSCDADLSILNQSAMNDSLLDDQLTKEPSMSLFVRPRSMSQCNFFSPEKVAPQKGNRRSMSVTDAPKNSISSVDGSMASAQSSMFEDPLNNAFRTSLKSSVSSSVSGLNSQFDLSMNKQRVDRLNSDSSVFSNISAITTDPQSKMRQDRFCSESSAYSNLSNLSIIPNNTVTSCDSSVFVNDTMNKAFVGSRSQLNSTSSVSLGKTPSKAEDTSDLIKKFYQIKSGMSTSRTEGKSNNSTFGCENDSGLSKSKTVAKDESLRKLDERLIDVGNNSDSPSNNESGINDIIFSEARTLAETFEKMASSKGSNTTEDDFLFSKTQLNFDDLPASDDEAVDNLIELSGGESEIKEPSEVATKSSIMSPKDEAKALENEFIDNKDAEKKAAAATLLLGLEKLLQEQDYPDGFKVLTDLQKMLGVECDNNTEMLQVCLQNSMSPKDEKKIKNNANSSRSLTDNHAESCETISNNEKVAKNKSNNSSNDIADLISQNESKDVISDNMHSQVHSKKEPREQNNDSIVSEDQKLALNFVENLSKIVGKSDGNSASDVFKSLGAALSMALESRTKSKDRKVSPEKEIRKSASPKKMNRSISSLYKSPTKKNLAVKKTQNASFETLPLRKSISASPSYSNRSNTLLDVPSASKRKSQLLSLKKRFPSDPGFADAADKKKVEAAAVASKSTLGASKPTIEPIKAKLKMKPTSDAVSKRGPMKAIIPLGSMQKSGVKTNELGSVTPPSKAHLSVPTVKIVSSTPNSSGNPKSKPAASSTPNTNESRTPRVKPSPLNSSRSTTMSGVSPVSLNSSSKTHVSRRSELVRSPRSKKPSTPRRSETPDSSRLPRYSPRPVRVRNYSFSDTKSTKSPQQVSGSLKVASEKILRHSSVLSPLRNSNKLSTKAKPMSLMPKLSKSLASKSGPEKENYA